VSAGSSTGRDPSGDGAIDVTVLVPVRNEARWIRDTAAAMRAQRHDGRLEFLFIDGRSDDGTSDVLAELAAEDPRIRTLDNPDGGIPSALNIGLREARGRYVARMDAHSWYPPDYLARAIDRLKDGDVAWVTGPAAPVATGAWARRVSLALASPLGQGGSRKWTRGHGAVESAQASPAREHDLDTGVFGGVWLRQTLEGLGGWDEGWSVNEDVEMAARVLESGGRIVCLPELAAGYAPRDSLLRLAHQYWRFGYYRAKTSSRHPIALCRSHLLSAALAGDVLASLALPRRYARLPRRALGAYGLVLVAAGLRTAGEEPPRDAAGVPVVLATMHISWGLGFLTGCVRFGPPVRAALRAVTGRAGAKR
jgi:succinoglycan biosynthesis protein ExoA